MDLGLTDRVALVGGSTSGLGLASARALASEGARVVLVGRRSELLASLVEELPGSSAVTADLLEAGDRARVVDHVRQTHGHLDVLVLNAGGPAPGTASELGVDGARAAVERLLVPHVELADAFVPGMRERGWGRVLAIGSTGVQQPIPGLAASNVGRAALAGYLKSLAHDVAADGVTVNLVLPGRVATDRLTELDGAAASSRGVSPDEVRRGVEAGIPVGRYGRPDELGAVVAFLAGVGGSYVTGEQVRVDGGLVGHH